MGEGPTYFPQTLSSIFNIIYNSHMISSQFLQSLGSGEEDAIQTLVRAYQRPVFQLALSILDDGAGSETSRETIAEAELATQQTFMTALDRLNRYREDDTFEIWLYTIAIEVSRKAARRRGTLGRLMKLLPGQQAAAPAGSTSRSTGRAHTAHSQEAAVGEAGEAGPEPSDLGASPVGATGVRPAGVGTAGAAGLSTGPAAGAAPSAPLSTGSATAAPMDDSLWQAIRNLDLKMRLPVVLRYYHDFPVDVISRMLKLSEGAVHARLDAARERIAGKLEEKR